MQEDFEPQEHGPETAQNQNQADAMPGEFSQDSRNMAMLCHLLGLLTNFLGPLILWLIKKDEDAFVDEQGKEALNFQITLIIGYIVGGITTPICIGFALIPLVGIADIVFSIIACVAASKGEHYRYPMSIRLIK